MKSIYNPGLAAVVLVHIPIGIYYIYFIQTRGLAGVWMRVVPGRHDQGRPNPLVIGRDAPQGDDDDRSIPPLVAAGLTRVGQRRQEHRHRRCRRGADPAQ